jgi:hypothetical protein
LAKSGEKEMEKIPVTDSEAFVTQFIKEYLTDGFGSMPKREIDILVMNLLMEHANLSDKSNHDLSILLQTTEARIKNIRYEARLKYPPDEDYVKREFLVLLARSQFELDKRAGAELDQGKIVFVMEDDYLRHAIQGHLKEKGMFTDTSFNREIVKISPDSLMAVIREFYGEEVGDQFQEGFDELASGSKEKATKKYGEVMLKFAMDTAKSFLSAALVTAFKARLGI